MKFIFSNYIKKLRDIYAMPLRFQNQIADRNLEHLNVVSVVLFISGIINIIIAYFLHKDNLQSQWMHFIYYALVSGISIICHLWVQILRKIIKTTQSKVKNIPVYFANVGFLAVFLLNFWPDGEIFSHFNGFVLISCVEFISILYFNIYPNIFDLMHFPFITVIFILEIDNIGLIPAFNVFIYFIILHLLSVSKWLFTKNRLLSTEKIENINANLNREIDLAAAIQSNFLSINLPELPGWNINYYCKAMAGVTGDMFDIYTHNKTLDGFGIFDVSGHGISSGLITMLVKNVLRREFYATKEMPLDEAMDIINAQIIQQKGQIENYLTGILARVNGGKIDFVAAGHPLPLIYRKKTNELDFYVETNGDSFGVIGLADFPVKYAVETLELDRGDEMILYSDGILDAENSNGEEFGRKRFLETVKNYISLRPQDQINFIVEEVRAFRGKMPQKDDITILVIKKM